MSDLVDQELQAIADQYEKDLDEVREIYDDKLAHIKGADVIGIDEEDYPVHALRTVRSNLQAASRGGFGPSGEAVEIPILAIGLILVTDTWGEDDDHVAVGIGLAAPPDTEDENRPAGLCAFIMSESRGMDIGRAREMWQWGEHIRGWFSIDKLEEAFASRSRTYYVANSTDKSKIESADFSGDLPSDPEGVRSLLAEKFIPETFALRPGEDDDRPTLPDAISVEGEEFGSGWLDLRRFKGHVVDSFRRLPDECEPDQNPFGKYVLIDDTVASAEELERDRDLVSESDVENGRQPGLQVFLPPEAVQYGVDSTVEVYGVVNRNNESGQITMRGAGVAPIIPFPYGEEDGAEEEEL